jgi:hypothetical protein
VSHLIIQISYKFPIYIQKFLYSYNRPIFLYFISIKTINWKKTWGCGRRRQTGLEEDGVGGVARSSEATWHRVLEALEEESLEDGGVGNDGAWRRNLGLF